MEKKEMDMSVKLWDFWADRYSRLWVQKVSLGPTRDYILGEIKEMALGRNTLLDLGCGPGELLYEIGEKFPQLELTGVDYSPRMLEISQQRNGKVRHMLMDAADLDQLEIRYDIIVCTHSLPYYRDPKEVFRKLSRILSKKGRLMVGFASGNSVYDQAVLSAVKLTTGKAHYPSDREFVNQVKEYFQVLKLKIIKKRAFFMPRIAVYTLGRKMDSRE
jgi:ubiquinone/menaquinone biosynthesis C-methylase UbiE